MAGFAKSSPELLARFDELSTLVDDAERRLMFGYPSLRLNGNMFMSLYEQSLILRLSDDDRREFTSEYGDAVEFAPMPGRAMKSYVVVPTEVTTGPAVEQWVLRSHQHAQTLPPKKPKPTPPTKNTRQLNEKSRAKS